MRQRFESRPFLQRQRQCNFRASRAHARLLVEQYERAALFISLSTDNEGSPTMADECLASEANLLLRKGARVACLNRALSLE